MEVYGSDFQITGETGETMAKPSTTWKDVETSHGNIMKTHGISSDFMGFHGIFSPCHAPFQATGATATARDLVSSDDFGIGQGDFSSASRENGTNMENAMKWKQVV